MDGTCGLAAPAGDTDGDGFDDLAVWSELTTVEMRQQGSVRVFPGGAGGWSDEELWSVLGTAPGERLGTTVVPFDDPDGSRCTGLVVTSAFHVGTEPDTGRAAWYPSRP